MEEKHKDCKCEGCTRYPISHGLCDGHRKMAARGEELRPLRDRAGRMFCAFPGCERPHHAHSYCWSHYKQSKQNKELKKIRNWVRKQTEKEEN